MTYLEPFYVCRKEGAAEFQFLIMKSIIYIALSFLSSLQLISVSDSFQNERFLKQKASF